MSNGRRFSSHWLPWVLLVAVLAVALIVGGRAEATPSVSERTLSVAATIRCPQCTDKSMAASDAPTSVAGRNEIRRQIEAGRTPDEIRTWFADRYGSDILLTPSRRGIEGLIWAIPVIAFVLAAAVLAAAFVRWNRLSPDPLTDDERHKVEVALAGLHATDGEDVPR